jgi:hypothetical protein
VVSIDAIAVDQNSYLPEVSFGIMSKTDDGKITPTPTNLKEVKLSWAGKLFFGALAATLGAAVYKRMEMPVKVRGTPQQLQAISDAIVASRQFQAELQKPGATVESVIQKLQIRNMTKDRFERITGKPWPL